MGGAATTVSSCTSRVSAPSTSATATWTMSAGTRSATTAKTRAAPSTSPLAARRAAARPSSVMESVSAGATCASGLAATTRVCLAKSVQTVVRNQRMAISCAIAATSLYALSVKRQHTVRAARLIGERPINPKLRRLSDRLEIKNKEVKTSLFFTHQLTLLLTNLSRLLAATLRKIRKIAQNLALIKGPDCIQIQTIVFNQMLHYADYRVMCAE